MTDTTIVQEVVLIRQRVERIEAAMMRTSGLLNMTVLDMCKAYEGIQKHAGRLDNGLHVKPHVNLSKPAFRSHRNGTDTRPLGMDGGANPMND
ncbi:MAG: hypothetical protein K9L23_22290 [Desulfotignum sp.]|nr:hypothetical protein [Desulfotignum sp.]MCF8090776.1 hypothetical protein [Desulfotignum sp.]